MPCGRRAFQNCAKWRWNSAVGSKKRRWAKGKGIYFSLTGCRLPKGLYTSLYQCIQPEIPRADVYLNCSILKKEFPLHFDEGSTPEKSALLNLHVDWGHLVLIIQTAPDFPIKKLAKELADACEMEGRIFLAIQKDCNHYGSTGQGFPARHCPALSDTIAVLVGEEAKSLSMFFETNKRKVPDFT